MDDRTHIVDFCNAALESVRSSIPADLYSEVFDYVNRYDEWGLGMETLIDGMSESDIKISEDQFAAIRRAMAVMNMDDLYRVRYLWNHNVIHPSTQH